MAPLPLRLRIGICLALKSKILQLLLGCTFPLALRQADHFERILNEI